MNEKPQLDRDLEALRDLSAGDVPDLDTTIQAIRRRGAESGPRRWDFRRNVMALFHSIRTRPAAAVAAAGVLAALVAMVLPVSYERVVGQDVVLTLAGRGSGEGEIGDIARELKGALGAGSVTVEAIDGDGGPSLVLRAMLPKRLDSGLQRATADFAQALASRGYSASVRVTPRRERVRNLGVAYAFDQIVQISVDGKSAAALEQEIRSRLAQAGVPNAQVSVTDRPEGGREVRLKMEREQEGSVPGMQPEPMPQIVLTKDGAPLTGGDAMTVKVQKRKVDGSTTLVVDVTSNGRSAKVEVPNPESMSDPALAEAISSQLRQAGIDARVTVAGGRVSIEATK
jgi:type IV pilus biogenesis protein CpaD/CtpE